MTPEQQLRNTFETLLEKRLPKGRYLLQPIETNTVGVPDYYFAYNDASCWIEAKTTDYNVDRFQINWAIAHQRAHPNTPNKTLILTAIAAHQQPQPIPPNPPPTRTPRATLYMLAPHSNMLDYSTLGAYIKKERPAMVAVEDWLKSFTSLPLLL